MEIQKLTNDEIQTVKVKTTSKPLSDARAKQLQELMNERYKVLRDYIEELSTSSENQLDNISTPLTQQLETIEKKLARLNIKNESLESAKKDEITAVNIEIEQNIDKKIAGATALIVKLQNQKKEILENTQIEITKKYKKREEQLTKEHEDLETQQRDILGKIKIEKSARKSVVNSVIRGIKADLSDQHSQNKVELWTLSDSNGDAKNIFDKIPSITQYQQVVNPDALNVFYLEIIKDIKIPDKCPKCGGMIKDDYGNLRCQKCWEHIKVNIPRKFEVSSQLKLEHKQ